MRQPFFYSARKPAGRSGWLTGFSAEIAERSLIFAESAEIELFIRSLCGRKAAFKRLVLTVILWYNISVQSYKEASGDLPCKAVTNIEARKCKLLLELSKKSVTIV